MVYSDGVIMVSRIMSAASYIRAKLCTCCLHENS